MDPATIFHVWEVTDRLVKGEAMNGDIAEACTTAQDPELRDCVVLRYPSFY